ncbi:hypothetical protein ES708_11105 [subsurface metagenome]
MRSGLEKYNKERHRFIARFERMGSKSAYRGPDIQTVLLVEVRDFYTEELLTEHLWFNYTKAFHTLHRNGKLNPGDIISFDARVKTYLKGYRGRRNDFYEDFSPIAVDFHLTYPTRIERIRDKEQLQTKQ